MKKRIFITFIILATIFIIISTFFIFKSLLFEKDFPGYCGDGTYYGRCSQIKPYFCINETLIENATYCGCKKNFSILENKCVSNLETGEKSINIEYLLNGENKNFNLKVYTGVYDYVSNLDRSITYSNNSYSREDFVIKAISEPTQKEFLNKLLIEIYNLGNNKEERKQIAISLVQKFNYKSSEKVTDFHGTKIEHSRYPYEVLYEKTGICGEKSELLAFLLNELGYDVVIFYFPVENHEAVGIKCRSEDFRDTGYCYIETTSVFPIGIDPAEILKTGEFNNFEILKIED